MSENSKRNLVKPRSRPFRSGWSPPSAGLSGFSRAAIRACRRLRPEVGREGDHGVRLPATSGLRRWFLPRARTRVSDGKLAFQSTFPWAGDPVFICQRQAYSTPRNHFGIVHLLTGGVRHSDEFLRRICRAFGLQLGCPNAHGRPLTAGSAHAWPCFHAGAAGRWHGPIDRRRRHTKAAGYFLAIPGPCGSLEFCNEPSLSNRVFLGNRLAYGYPF